MGSFRDFANENEKLSKLVRHAPPAPRIEQEKPQMIQKPQITRRVTVPRRQQPRERNVLAESENMISVLQEKIEQVFYQFGLAGLQRIDGAIIDCVNEMLDPETAPVRGPSRAAVNQTVRQAGGRPQPAAPVRRKPMSALEIAAAALRDLPPMHEIESAPVKPAEQAPAAPAAPAPAPRPAAHVPPPPPPEPAEYDPMAALANEKLSPEEMALLQKELAAAGEDANAGFVPAQRNMDAMALAAAALQR